MRVPVLYTDVHTPHSNAMANCLGVCQAVKELCCCLCFLALTAGPQPQSKPWKHHHVFKRMML